MNMAADVIKKEGIKGEYKVIDRNKKIAQDVRKVMCDSGSTMPENLPVAETIKAVEKRVKAARKIASKF
jgi:DNA-damage-inducible protein D